MRTRPLPAAAAGGGLDVAEQDATDIPKAILDGSGAIRIAILADRSRA